MTVNGSMRKGGMDAEAGDAGYPGAGRDARRTVSDGGRGRTRLNGVSETLLIPVWARAVESLRADGLVQDTYALRMVDAIDYDFEKFRNSWISQTGVAVRTRILDRAVARFLARHPQGVVVLLGCGLDARSRRMDNNAALWIELDLPEVIAWRRGFFDEDARHRMLGVSVFDTAWFAEVPPDRPVLILAEGLFMYLPPDELRGLVRGMAEAFPGGELVFEALSRSYVGRSARHDTVSKCDASFTWGIDKGSDICGWSPRLEFMGDLHYFDCPRNRWRWLWWIRWLPPVRRMVRISSFRFRDAASDDAA